MFNVDLSTAIFLYLLILLVGIILAWIYYEYRFKAKRVKKSEKNIYRCPICAYVYIVEKDETFMRCARCSTLNKVN